MTSVFSPIDYEWFYWSLMDFFSPPFRYQQPYNVINEALMNKVEC
mgnify:CR=1 FL=1